MKRWTIYSERSPEYRVVTVGYLVKGLQGAGLQGATLQWLALLVEVTGHERSRIPAFCSRETKI